ncbi:glycosyltransferase family 4 protein [Nodosilinea sp. P-1105]|uniref:glycosyltransferase family 4 protein n=1 Tax=Nodosilinea sp. P-1105 TaxID=2546229 RepID=UPI00146B6DB0|nr:glycosyltransferase family 4 protein [Nodosilinea sp. P-1105]NMF83037.1 glycosyltransferase [Nodosilinea sp. P-1105]
MNPIIISEADSAGAGKAALRLHQGLQLKKVKSSMLVQTKAGDTPDVYLPSHRLTNLLSLTRANRYLDSLPLKAYRNRKKGAYSLNWFPDSMKTRIFNNFKPDIINLHWINFGYLRLETLANFDLPVVWTLHDMWAFTGGCHYTNGCEEYKRACGKCPQLSSHSQLDLSRWVMNRKLKSWKNLNLTVVTPSRWLAERARESSLFSEVPIKVIPNGLDVETYKPMSQQVARDRLNLPQDRDLILFGSVNATSDNRKGFDLLKETLSCLELSQGKHRPELVIFGSTRGDESNDLSLKSHYLGRLNDDISLSIAYSAADVFVAPSREDNLPNTVMEALACGTPCAAFKIGGMPDLIDHRVNGYLAKPFDPKDLAVGIQWILSDDSLSRQELRKNAREKVESSFSDAAQAEQYIALFDELLSQ